MAIETDDSATIEYTGRLQDGTVFDTSRESVARENGLTDAESDREYTPLTVDVGAGRLIEGLEEALVGLEEGDRSTVTVPPEKAYGQRSEERVREYDSEDFREMLAGQTPREGAQVETQDGGRATIVHVDDDVVRVDFNHELAGETLEFDVEVVSVD
jgi:FKBP-type peptidyl-prolyl cis-trans isomerase 2